MPEPWEPLAAVIIANVMALFGGLLLGRSLRAWADIVFLVLITAVWALFLVLGDFRPGADSGKMTTALALIFIMGPGSVLYIVGWMIGRRKRTAHRMGVEDG